ncbi:MAG: hypothetical protein JWQ33_1034 [Ramlibacter sp.]|nr:hypothetical protein [Ramlibacter sp.]
MDAAFVILIIGLIAGVLGWAEIKRAAAQGPGTAVAGILFAVAGLALILVGLTRLLFWS